MWFERKWWAIAEKRQSSNFPRQQWRDEFAPSRGVLITFGQWAWFISNTPVPQAAKARRSLRMHPINEMKIQYLI